jgi:hypothetical protein
MPGIYLSKLGIKVGDTASIVPIVLEWLHLVVERRATVHSMHLALLLAS